MTPSNTKAKQIAIVGLMSAILCILAPFCLPIPTSPVPISLGNMAVCFVITVLGMKYGCISVLVYLLLGLVGLPVFSNFTGGVGKLLGPTGGYLLGYLLLALFLGFFIERFHNHPVTNALGAVAGMLVLYLFGTLWLALQLDLDLYSALWAGVIPYIPADIIKLTLAITIGTRLRQRLLQADML